MFQQSRLKVMIVNVTNRSGTRYTIRYYHVPHDHQDAMGYIYTTYYNYRTPGAYGTQYTQYVK